MLQKECFASDEALFALSVVLFLINLCKKHLHKYSDEHLHRCFLTLTFTELREDKSLQTRQGWACYISIRLDSLSNPSKTALLASK
jgi:hypothetical protein